MGRDLWIGFVKNLTDTGIVDGLFDDKHNIFAMWNETGSFWQICEHPTGRNIWNISCGVISNETAMKYNNGKPQVLNTLHKMFGPTGFVFFNTTKKLRMELESISPLNFAQDIQTGLSTYKYCYVQTTDLINGDCTNTTSSCSEDQIAMFLLGVERGAILGCNGWDEQFSKPLGDPIGPAVQKGDQAERHFKSGTYATWNLASKSGKVFWANSTSI